MDGNGATPELLSAIGSLPLDASTAGDQRSSRTRGPAVSIVPANLRDLSYIASNLRPDDRAEIECQLDQFSSVSVAALSMRDYAFVVELNANPEAAFGAARARPDASLWIAWAWGTKRIPRCVPAMAEFINGHMIPMIVRDGAQRCEARALATNRLGNKFLERIGATRRCELPGYGKGGETFILYDWTRDNYVIHEGLPQCETRWSASA